MKMTDHGVSQLIGSAERHIAEKRFDLALNELSAAQQLDPANTYIQAIIDRVYAQQHTVTSESRKSRYLSVTVGSQYPDGVKNAPPASPTSAKGVQARIKNLTLSAERKLQEGLVADAFDTLMHAYLIDPNSPDVLACEGKVIPAWNQLNTNPTARSEMNQQWRLDMLKQQKDHERRQKERTVWRDASKPLSVLRDSNAAQAADPATHQDTPARHHDGGIFSKIKRGKLLG